MPENRAEGKGHKDYPREWLLYRLSSLGDVALTSGPMRYWHERQGWLFTVLTRTDFAPLFERNPAVRSVLSPNEEQLRLPGLLSFFSELASAHRGKGLLDLHGTPRSRLLGGLWSGPVRRYPKMSLRRRLFLLRRSPADSAILREHSVAQRYALALEPRAPSPGDLLPEIYLAPEETRAAKARLRGIFNFSARAPSPLVALHPYATHCRKAWPEEYWRVFVRELEQAGLNWLVLGRGGGIFPGDARDLSNRTSLRELCALLAEARALVTGDSGPMHLAVAVRTPVLALFGPTTAEWGFFPAGEHDFVLESDLSCRPCSLHGRGSCPLRGLCLESITPAEVMRRLQDLPGTGPDRR
ncbi:MAG: glycosyltransferase family 9 protein [Deltaproteobacteria bacterium]|nr:glycosyltransferase family 9 protein [Deltaproteobacteria bacterium]